MVGRTPQDKLNAASRLNYAKIYTVEHNVKVLFIGKIASEHVHRLVDTYNRISKVTGPTTYYDTYDTSSSRNRLASMAPHSSSYQTGALAGTPRTYGSAVAANFPSNLPTGSSSNHQPAPADSEAEEPQYEINRKLYDD